MKFSPRLPGVVKLAHAFLWLALTLPAFAGPWQKASDFTCDAARREGFGYVALPTANDKFYVGGYFSSWNGTPRFSLARVAADGQLDTTYHPAAVDFFVMTAVELANGKLLIGGSFNTVGGESHYGLARLNADGSVDSSFTASGHYFTQTLAVLADGKILVGGNSGLLCLNADGSTAAGFIRGGGFNGYVNALVVQASGKIVVAGDFTDYNGTACSRIARLNPDGSLDASFATGGGFDNTVNALAIDASGRLVAGGGFANFAGTARKRVARLTADGALDTSFDPSATLGMQWCFTVATAGDTVYAGGFGSTTPANNNFLVRLAADGAVDTAFAANFPALGYGGSVSAIGINSAGRLLAVGNFGGQAGSVSASYSGAVGVEADGRALSGFTALVCTPGTVYAVQPTGTNQFLVAGEFTHINGQRTSRLFARINADGSPDLTFNAGNDGANGDRVRAFAQQADGKIVLVGQFYSYNTQQRTHLARVLSDGTLDTTFNANGVLSFGGDARSVALQGSDKILVAGLDSVGGYMRPFFRRLNSDGSIDSGFAGNTGFSTETIGFVSEIQLDADGRIYLVGWFDSYQGTACKNIVRLTADGNLDPTFSSSSLAGSQILTLLQRPAGKLWIAGTLTPQEIAADGTLNPAFNASGAYVTRLLALGDSVIALGDLFLRRYLANGAEDTTFQTSGLGNLRLFSGATLPDGSLLLAGDISLLAPNTQTLMKISAPVATPTGYAAWRLANFSTTDAANDAVSGPGAIASADGLTNLAKYALGLPPTTPAQGGLPSFALSGADWTFTFTRPADRSDVSYTVEFSTDLVEWQTTTATLQSETDGRQTWTALVASSGRPQIFFRLRFTRAT